MKPGGILFATLVSVAMAQTTVNLRTQARDVDLTAAPYTKPFKSGASLPAICSTGEFFFKINAVPGRNLYACTATDMWTLQAPAVNIPTTATPGVLWSDGTNASWTGLAGDLSGAPAGVEVRGVQGYAVSEASPTDGQSFIWNAASQRWEPRAIPSAAADNTWSGKQIFQPAAVQNVTAQSQISPDRVVMQLSAGGDTGITATPTITSGADGQWLILVNVSAQFSITLQPEELLNGSNVRTAGAKPVTIRPRQAAAFFFNASVGDWIQSGGGAADGAGGVFSALADVAMNTPLSGDLPFYDATEGKWKNKALVGGGSGAIEVDTTVSPVEIELNSTAAKQYLSTTIAAADSIPRADAAGKIAAEWLPAISPTAHAASHQNGGTDEIATVTPSANAIPKAGSTGKLDAAWFPSVAPSQHAPTHQDGGSDEIATATPAANAIPKAGGTGKLDAGWLPPIAPGQHGTTHQNGGTDEIATATPAANAIPKAGSTGKLDAGWLPSRTTTMTIPFPIGGGSGAGGTGTIGNGWTLPVTGAATVTVGSANNQYVVPVLLFSSAAGATTGATLNTVVPLNWDSSAVNLLLDWYHNGGPTGTIKLNFASLCRAPGDPLTKAPNSPVTDTLAVASAAASTLIRHMHVVAMSGCAAGDMLSIRIWRDNSDPTVTFTDHVRMAMAQLRLTVAVN